jgi:site-specific recombinase XerC
MLFDWLILGNVLEINPAAALRGPKHLVNKGKTPVFSAEAARRLPDSIGNRDLVPFRDRAVISVCVNFPTSNRREAVAL